ncbi:MAG: DUF421 domain-containing protein [Oscillospiraceae bacterium]|nr:DUF421 domain-containing protein [Oscillospiraceae bacterium]
MAIIFVRTVILYFAILISMRIMGKRQLGEMEISEFIVAALIADLAATPLQDIGIPLLNGLVPIIIMFCFEIIIAGLNMRSLKLRKLTYGRPEIIIRNGRIIREAMQKNRFTLDELMQELRAQGLTDTAQVEYAVLETNGQLSIILKSGDQPATASQMGVVGDDVSYAHIIINEGRILDNNLELLGRDRRWLSNELKRQNFRSADEVYILTLSESGRVFCQAKEG